MITNKPMNLNYRVPVAFNPFIDGQLMLGIEKAYLKAMNISKNDFTKGFVTVNDKDYELFITPKLCTCFYVQNPEYVHCLVSFQELAENTSNVYKRRAIAKPFVEQNAFVNNIKYIANEQKAGF